MFDIAPSEFMLFAVVALLVIGPKDLPRAMRFVGKWVGKARGMVRQVHAGFDAVIREAELAEMEQKWKAENARIVAEHSNVTDVAVPKLDTLAADKPNRSPDALGAEPPATARQTAGTV